jgi:hypothetical protein
MRCFRDAQETQRITSLSVEGIIIYKKKTKTEQQEELKMLYRKNTKEVEEELIIYLFYD